MKFVMALLLVALVAPVVHAQSPAASSATNRDGQPEGFYQGWGFGTRFEGEHER